MPGMIGGLLVSHGALAPVALETALEIVGELPCTTAVAVPRHEALDVIRARIAEALDSVDDGAGVLVFADVFGGTAANVVSALAAGRQVEIVAGFNLPMLLKFASARPAAAGLLELATELARYGQKNVLVASELTRAGARPA